MDDLTCWVSGDEEEDFITTSQVLHAMNLLSGRKRKATLKELGKWNTEFEGRPVSSRLKMFIESGHYYTNVGQIFLALFEKEIANQKSFLTGTKKVARNAAIKNLSQIDSIFLVNPNLNLSFFNKNELYALEAYDPSLSGHSYARFNRHSIDLICKCSREHIYMKICRFQEEYWRKDGEFEEFDDPESKAKLKSLKSRETQI